MNQINFWILKVILFFLLCALALFLILLVWFLLLKNIFGETIFEWFILGGSVCYSFYYANRLTNKILSRYEIKENKSNKK